MGIMETLKPKRFKKPKKAFGGGDGPGLGNSGKGHKGQKARSGGTVRWGFEGGQMPLFQHNPSSDFRMRCSKAVRSG